MKRVDRLLVERGFVASRSRGQQAIRDRCVQVDGVTIDRVSTLVSPTAELSVDPRANPYVSRAGGKLRAALDAFPVSVEGRRCVDLGASTGGFTDCLLQAGAASVVSVDVGTAQMHATIGANPAVTVVEGMHIAEANVPRLGGPFDLVVADLSFISMTRAAAHIARFVAADGDVIVLVKPQFEVGRGGLDKRGVVRDEERRLAAVELARDALGKAGLCHKGEIPSPVRGASGNQEVLVWLSKDVSGV
ncbi:MAG: TlyA family RNA methyltransferase [Actinobacteria bacterium]|nr:TlyA family RNA methyltransferase [Actinomycetota bacterium]